MKRKTKIIIILLFLIFGAIFVSGSGLFIPDANYATIADTNIGTVEVGIYGNPNATNCIALITGIHPRETLAIDPEINEIGRASCRERV